MGIYATNIEVDGVEDVPVAVHYDAIPFFAGRTDGKHGPKIEPDEPGRIEIESVHLVEDGREITLTTAWSTNYRGPLLIHAAERHCGRPPQ